MHDRGFVENIWGMIRFYNARGAAQEANPKNIVGMRYEDLKADTETNLKIMCDFIGIKDVSADTIKRAVQKSSKSEMKKNIATDAPQFEKIVNINERNPEEWFNDTDKEFLQKVCDRYLKYDFGYLEQKT